MNPIVAVVAYPQFELVEFNDRRRRRGAEAARVRVTYSSAVEDWELLWMTPRDVRANLATFGESTELRRALAAYESPAVEPLNR